jgi:hypothetical protein
MPFPPHFRLEWGGDFASEPLEIWSNGINLAHDPDIDGAEFPSEDEGGTQEMLDHYSAKVVTHFNSANSMYGNNVRLKWIKFNEVLPSGLRKNQAKTWRTDIAGVGTPGSQTSQGAITHAMVVTFLTAASRGRASRGRVFVPHPSIPLSTSTFRYTSAAALNAATAWRTFLDALADAPGADGPSALIPVVITELETPGLYRPIIRAQVGDFPDYMGSRRNRTREVRVQSSLVTTTGL